MVQVLGTRENLLLIECGGLVGVVIGRMTLCSIRCLMERMCLIDMILLWMCLVVDDARVRDCCEEKW